MLWCRLILRSPFPSNTEKRFILPTLWINWQSNWVQLKVICDTLFSNRVTSLESVQREHTSDDASAVQAADYLDSISVTNNNTIITPYQVTFVCFSTELAGVLASFANQPMEL